MNAADLFPSLVLAVLATLVTWVATGRTPPQERGLVRGAMLYHLGNSVALLWVVNLVFGVSDTNVYLEEARPIVVLLEQHFGDVFGDVMRIIVNLPSHVPGYEDPGGASTSMIGMTALGLFLTGGSVLAVFMVFGFLSFLGKWALYAGLRAELPSISPKLLALAVLFVPSAVFWTSGLVKETFAVAGVGFAFLGAQRIRRGFDVGALFLLALGLVLTGTFKPYLLFPLALGGRSLFFAARSTRYPLLSPIVGVLAVVVSIAAIAALGKIMPEFAADKIVEQTATLRERFAEGGGGSNFDTLDVASKSTAGRLLLAPIALVTALARPLPFEAHNLTSFITALETLAITVLAISTVRRAGLRRVAATISEHRALMFCALFVLVGATAIGMATSNFGTLSRYRTPLLPFYVALILAVRELTRSSAAEPSVAAPELDPGPRSPLQPRRLRGVGWLR
jgi:hypothetical protein